MKTHIFCALALLSFMGCAAPRGLVQRLSDQFVTTRYRNTDKIVLTGSEGGYGASTTVTITAEFLIQEIWDSIYQSRPHDVWYACGYRKLEFHQRGQGDEPVLTLMVNASDACHIEGTSDRFRCPGINAILEKLLKTEYEKRHGKQQAALPPATAARGQAAEEENGGARSRP